MNEPGETIEPARLDRGRGEAIRLASSGAVLAMLSWLVYSDLLRGVIPYIGKAATMFAFAGLGAWIGMGRGRKWVWGFAFGAVALLLIAGFTPLVPYGMSGLLQSDPPEKAPAVLVLAAGVDRQGSISAAGRARLDRAFELMGQGYAETLILTEASGPHNNWVPAVRRRLQRFGLNYPIETVGPVVNTHDEAVLAERLARERGWTHLLLVTHPWHMRRASALFEKLGLRVVRMPCEEIDYDPRNPKMGRARLRAFQDWSHEVGGLIEYRARGWIP